MKNTYSIYNNKQLLFVGKEQEIKLIEKIYYMIKSTPLRDLDSKEILFLQVSPDYSGVVSTILMHKLNNNGCLSSIESVIVPYPNENSSKYETRFEHDFSNMLKFNNLTKDNHFILCEAGILSGRNYTWITDIMINKYSIKRENITTVALYENIKSIFKSDFVGEYFDYSKQDLCFWWENPTLQFGDLNWI